MGGIEDVLRPADLLPSYAGEGWPPTRVALRKLLSVNAPTLVPLYEAAVRMLLDVQFPGRTHLIAHCVREIGNSLPSFFDGAAKGHADYPGIVEAIVQPWLEAGLPVATEAAPVPISGQAGATPPAISVPLPIVRQVGRLVEVHTAVAGRREHNAVTLFRALAPDPDGDAHHLRPTINLWLDTCDWFQARVHHNRQQQDSNTDDNAEAEFIRYFERFEELLHSMTEPFLDIAKSLDEELDQANS